jgi:hypothetical protein
VESVSINARLYLAIISFAVLVTCCVTIGFFSKSLSNEFAVQIIIFATAASGICFPVFIVSAARKYFEQRHGSPFSNVLKKILKMK